MFLSTRRWRILVALLAALTLMIAACGDDDDGDVASSGDVDDGGTTDDTTDETTDDTADDAEGSLADIPVVDVVASGEEADDGSMTHSFGPLAGLTAGPTVFNLVNEGLAPHHVQLFKLNDDATMDDFGAALQTGDVGALLGVGTFVGGTGVTDPGSESSADALVELEEGSYVMLCFIEDENGVPHLATGMVEPFEVGPADGDVPDLPEPDETVELVDFGFSGNQLPASGVVELVNASEAQLHEMSILQLGDGKSIDDVGAYFAGGESGPPPFAGLGGMQALMPGASQLLVVDVEEGDGYVLICAIPDPADGVPHAEKGMVSPASAG